MDVIRNRRSIRKYRPDPVPDELLHTLFEIARQTPSGKNLQPFYFIVVRDPETKRRMQLNPWV
ncbi:MAG TPA: nitroreductase family protein [Patescibacteria group bacterium]|nr:nitroreductase family protein [Patescibacteria group bacterium]